jgi:4-hydroxy-tetrahydrodipicolinate synthase
MDPAALDTVVGVPPTPFRKDGGLDLAAFERVIRRLEAGGIRAMTIAGNTGEFGALSPDEVAQLAKAAVAAVAPGTAVLIGVGGDLASAIQVAGQAADAGAHGVMIHEPAGPFRSADGWLAYHVAIARAVPDLAVVPYVRDPNVGASDIDALANAAGNLAAVKYAVPDPVRFASIAADVRADILWICGLAELWVPFFTPAGTTAFTSGLAAIAPELSLSLLAHLRSGQRPAAHETWSLLRPFEELRARRQGAANVPAIKEALAQLGLVERWVRPPISLLPATERQEIAAILDTWKQGKGIAAA